MIRIFQKYQKGILSVIAVATIGSIVFFGSYSASQMGRSVARVERSELEEMSDALLGSDLLHELLVDGIAEEVANRMGEGEWESRLDRVRRFRPYSHPAAPFLSAEKVWEKLAPDLLTTFHEVQENPTRGGLIRLWVAQEKFSPELLRKVLHYYAVQYAQIPPDPRMHQADLSIAGFRSPVEAFGRPFIQELASLVLKGADEAKRRGMRSEKEGVEGKLELFMQLLDSTAVLTVADPLLLKEMGKTREEAVVEVMELPPELELKDSKERIAWAHYVRNVAPGSHEPWPTVTASLDALPPSWVAETYELQIVSVDPEEVALSIPLRELTAWQEERRDVLDRKFPGWEREGSVRASADKWAREEILREDPSRMEAAFASAPVEIKTIETIRGETPSFTLEDRIVRILQVVPKQESRIRSFGELKAELMSEALEGEELSIESWLAALPERAEAAKVWGLRIREEVIPTYGKEISSLWQEGSRVFRVKEKRIPDRGVPKELEWEAKRSLAKALLERV